MPAAAFRAMPASPQSQSQQTSHNQSSRELPVLLPVRSDESIDMHDSADLEAERPRRFYYRDSTGKLRATRLWRCWTRVRRLLGFVVPLFKKDGNTFLCGPMVQNTVLNITLLFIRIFATQAILPWVLDGSLKAQECRHYARNFLDVSSYTLIAVVILCLPTLNIQQCKLHFKRESERGKALSVSDGSLATTGDNDEIELDADGKPQREDDSSKMRSRKTILLRICELTVILEVMYLCATLVMVFTTDSDVNIYDLIDACFHDEKTELVYGEVGGSGSDAPQYETYQEYLPARKLIVVILVMALAVVAYIIRWRQIVLFHHMHLHFLFQAGIIPARARFDYEDQEDELELRRQARRGPIMRAWDRFRRRLDAVAPESFIRERERRRLKGAIYRAAKRGQVEDLRLCLQQALELDGPKFADKWYTQPEYRFVPLLFTCRRMCNPLHVAVVYDESETLRELLSLQDSEGRMCFNVNALDKMESHRITMSWIYLGVFRIFSAVLRIIEGRSQSSMVNVLRPFGPSGVFDYTLISPLHVATTMGNPEMVRMLLLSGSADPNVSSKARDPQFSTPPLFWVRNNVECAQLLLEADADPLHIPSLRDQNYRYAPGAFSLMTAYELARLSGNNAVARLMEAYGADVALTPLHNASAHGDVANVSFYLSHGADPDSLGEQVEGLHSRTPLHWAAIRGQADVVRILLQFGASVEARDSMGRTPLAWACVLHRVSCVRVLLTHGANPNTRDINGDPLLCALAARTALKTRPLSRTASNLCVADMNVLQQPQFDQSPDDENTRDDGNDGGLDGKILKLLMNHGIDLKATREVNGDTALHVAMRRGNEHAAVLLVRAGLQLTARNARGQRALECTNSATLRYAVKKEAGQRDVMISYTHTHAALAMKLRDSLERANVTTWIDAMDPTGIPGGADWRREIASGIQNSALVVALLTRDYPQSPWCMKELAFARLHNVPVVGIQCEDMGVVPEELQVYLWTRQLVDFRPGIVKRPRHLLGGDEHHHGGTMLGSSDEETDEVEVRPITPDHGARGSVAVDIDAAPTTARLGSDSDEDEKEDGDGDNDDGMELIPNDSNSAFQECMQLLLDGIQDQIEEHRVRLEAQDANGGELRQTVLDNEEEQGHALGNASSSLARLVSSSDDTHPLVFIVHGDHHGAFCRRLRVALARRGIRAIDNQNAFIDAEGSSRGASTSQMRQIAAKDAIVASAAVIAVLSPTTVASGMLADQLAFAEDRGKVVIPLLLSLHSVALAHRYSFARSSVHHVNASLGFQESVTRLASELRGHLPSHFGTMVGDGHDKGLSRVSSLSSISDVVEVNSPSSFYGTAANVNDRENKRRTGSGGSGGGHGHGWRLRSPTNADDRNGSPPRQRTPTPPHRNGSTPQPRTPPPLLRIRSMDSGNEVGGESGVHRVDERRRASSNGDKPSRDHRQAR